MTLEQLRVFVAVAERQHLTRAAETLHLSQSAVSAAVSTLEERHGVVLFDRPGRGMALTEAGRLLLVEARAILARTAAAELALDELAGLRRGSLAVMASQTIAGYWLPRHLVALKLAHPGLSVSLSVGNTADVARAVTDGSAEVGFVEGTFTGAALVGEVVARDRLVVVVAPGHPWAAAPAHGPVDPATSEWVLREPGSGTRSAFEDCLPAGSRALRVAMELPSNEAVRAAVEAGLGATALSASVAAPSIEAGLLVQVPFPLADRAFTAIRHGGRHRGRAVQALLALVSAPG